MTDTTTITRPFVARRAEWANGNQIGPVTESRHSDVFSANAARHDWVITELLRGGTATFSQVHDEFKIDTARGTSIFLSVHRAS